MSTGWLSSLLLLRGCRRLRPAELYHADTRALAVSALGIARPRPGGQQLHGSWHCVPLSPVPPPCLPVSLLLSLITYPSRPHLQHGWVERGKALKL